MLGVLHLVSASRVSPNVPRILQLDTVEIRREFLHSCLNFLRIAACGSLLDGVSELRQERKSISAAGALQSPRRLSR